MVLFNLIFRLLSNVILMISNGCLAKFGHLQSTVNKMLENSAVTLVWKLCRIKEGGWACCGLNKSVHVCLNAHTCTNTQPSSEPATMTMT